VARSEGQERKRQSTREGTREFGASASGGVSERRERRRVCFFFCGASRLKTYLVVEEGVLGAPVAGPRVGRARRREHEEGRQASRRRSRSRRRHGRCYVLGLFASPSLSLSLCLSQKRRARRVKAKVKGRALG